MQWHLVIISGRELESKATGEMLSANVARRSQACRISVSHVAQVGRHDAITIAESATAFVEPVAAIAIGLDEADLPRIDLNIRHVGCRGFQNRVHAGTLVGSPPVSGPSSFGTTSP